MTERKFICIVCPVGCELSAHADDSGALSVQGNQCKRGAEYARTELTDPRRVLTGTVRLTAGPLRFLPVRTDKPVKRGVLRDAMRVLAQIEIEPPVKCGDVLRADFTEPGINLLAGRTVEREHTTGDVQQTGP